jgi:hypothetical protein
MAAYNFPNSPSDGDTVTSNGITYTYSSSKTRWDAAAASGSSTTVYATIDLLPLSGASTGDQAYVSGNNRLYIWNGSGWYNIALINTTPSISGVSSSYGLAVDGTATTVTITATDPEGIPITYSIASDTSGNVATVTQGTGANTNVFTITPTTNTANGGTFSLTFRASDGVNIATAVSSFTLVFSIQNSNYTTALITSVGANNAVNNSFDDASTNNHTITANGNVTQNTFSPHRHGGYSTYFDGSGDSLQLTTGGDLQAIGRTGTQCTVEAWVYLISVSGNGTGVYSQGTALTVAGNNILSFEIKSDRKVRGMVNGGYSNETGCPISSGTVPLNTWTHLALVLNSNTWTIYINGTADGTATGSYPSGTTHSTAFIGRVFYDAGRTGEMYTRNLRITNTAVYTSNFTPSTEPLTAITGTKLLACHLPYIADGSTNAHSITVNGNTKTEPFTPYDHNGYSSGSNSGSMYFEGSGDYLLMSSSAAFAAGTGDFTLEAWIYPTAAWGTWNGIFSVNNTGAIFFGGLDSGFGLRASAVTNIVSSTDPVLNTWTHVAVTRSGTTVRLFYNGVLKDTQTSSQNFLAGNLYIGSSVSSETFTGYIADARIVKGTAVYTSAFTPPTAPLTAITNTSLLLNGTDAAIIDKSQSVKTITLDGNVKSSTAQTKYLSSSMYFDGEGDYVRIDGNETLSSYAGDFTIEMWVYPTGAGPISGAYLYHQAASATSYSPILIVQSAGSYNFTAYASSTLSGWDLASAVSIGSGTQNSWHHIAVVREGTNLKTFLNGTLGTTTSVGTTSLGSATTTYTRLGGGNYANTDFTGYMSDVRITKGLARYTSNFTPPSAALQG